MQYSAVYTRRISRAILNVLKHLPNWLVLLLPAVAVGAPTVNDYDAVPPLLAESAKPMVMLAMSNDHQMFYKAYTDYDDLNNDGVVETTYENAIEYTGYFDPNKCYVYDTGNKRYRPSAFAVNHYCNISSNNEWSGNFLNWATMTRIDEVRKVLYGGMRSTDTNALTVLERAHLPNDAHSFAKYYNGLDLGRLSPFSTTTTGLVNSHSTGITICNTTRHAGGAVSQLVVDPPLARVVAGNYSLWAANERWQCLYSNERGASNGNSSGVTGIYAHSSNPSYSDKATQADGTTIGDYVVRIEVCSNSALLDSEDCKQYPGGNYKPAGLLQHFGDDGSVLWGLVTGSYKKNKSGGVLRKNIGDMQDEVNYSTDGTFKPAPVTGGIINTIDKLRMVNYNYSDGTYNATDSCSWGMNTFTNGSCTNWGNPFSEILMECYRYYAGKSADGSFDSDDSTILPGLTRQTTWSNPQTNDTACANLNVIAFNASTVSYDGDELSRTSDLNTSKTAEALTKEVGDGEGITNQYYFVGENGGTGPGDNNQLCTAKQVTDLGKVEGYCPTAPRLDGSFKAAGLAFHANTTDLRPDIDDMQKVTTYGVTLSPAIPKVTLTAPGGKEVSILPACRNRSINGNCGLVDFKIVEQIDTGLAKEGKFYVNWEDSEQGGDYDQDMAGIVKYKLTSTQLIVETDVSAQSTPDQMGFGFVVSGTTQDGFHSISGINSYDGYGCWNCYTGDAAKSKTFTLGSSVVGASLVGLLEQPLYYAAKWGGFVDMDGDGIPSSLNEWDQKNNTTGTLGADGKPDTYFLAVNPKQLKTQLTNILIAILERTASGTAAAVVTNTGTGEGAIYQALYNSRYAGANGVDTVSWVGTLNGLFIDRYGNIREDNAAPRGTLTDSDHVIDVFYDPVSKKTKLQRYTLGADGSAGTLVGTPVDVLDVKSIWSAGDELGKVSDYVTQRPSFATKANLGRYILTGIDQDGDGLVFESETLDFEASTFTSPAKDYFRLLGLNSSTKGEAANIVNYIRGEAVAGYRSRRIDLDGDGSPDPALLGDIVHSSPVAVGRPSAGYDVAFGDETYREFRQHYNNRRQVVYVGANDGMLHAFNGGFYDPINSAHHLKVTAETEHPLGSELWAYIPYNALPHLQWLTSANYPHVYYMDGHISYHDVNIFADDATHPGGWGTILVAGMRFGGGDYTLDPDSDTDADTSDDITLRSGFVILDVTDPEQPPALIAEITHEDLGYTTAEPDLIKMRAADPVTGSYASPSVNKWYLVFGSGPGGSSAADKEKALSSAISGQNAKLFVFDLKNKTLVEKDTGAGNSFIGGIKTADWTRDYIDDALYFGTVAGSINAPTGNLYRATLDSSMNLAISKVLNVNDQPFSATPLTVRDRLGDYWVYSGTGRFFVVDDNFSSAQQSYYGIKEPQTNAILNEDLVDKANLVNTSDIRVFTDGSIESKTSPGSGVSIVGAASPAKTFNDVYNAVQAVDGWYFDFNRARARNFTQAIISDQSLVFTEYQPSGLKCQAEGNGFLRAPHMHAGIPGEFSPLGTNPSNTNADGAEEVLDSASLGYGAPSEAVVHQRGDGQKAAIVQTSTGELSSTIIQAGISQGSRESWRELIIDWE